jgi:hypothetical protein
VIRNSRRMTALGIAGALALASALTGCGAGMNPETARPTQLTEGVNVSRADLNVQIRNMFVLGPAEDQTLAVGASAPVYATLIDSAPDGQPDKLVAVASNVSGAPTPLAGGGLTLPPGQAVSLNSPGGPAAVLTALAKTLVGGENIELALQFERAGVVKVTVPVVPQSGDFQTYPPAPSVPSPPPVSPTDSATATAGATATVGATAAATKTKKKKKAKKPATPTPTP